MALETAVTSGYDCFPDGQQFNLDALLWIRNFYRPIPFRQFPDQCAPFFLFQAPLLGRMVLSSRRRGGVCAADPGAAGASLPAQPPGKSPHTGFDGRVCALWPGVYLSHRHCRLLSSAVGDHRRPGAGAFGRDIHEPVLARFPAVAAAGANIGGGAADRLQPIGHSKPSQQLPPV